MTPKHEKQVSGIKALIKKDSGCGLNFITIRMDQGRLVVFFILLVARIQNILE